MVAHRLLPRVLSRLPVVALAAAWLAAPLLAHGGRDGDHDHDRAREAVQSGQALPLADVLQRLAREQPGQVLEVELERHGERWVYEVTLLQAGGQVRKLLVDARTARVLRGGRRDGPPPAASEGAP